MNWNIKDLDCSNMLIDPMNPRLVSFLEKNIPSFKKADIEYQDKVFTKSMIYRYILLQYDPESKIQKRQSLDWFGKKYEAVGYAGFNLKKGNDGYSRFDKSIDDMVFGKNDAINDLIIDFLAWSNNSKWQYIVFLQESMLGFTRDALGRKINKHKSSQDYMKLYENYQIASQDLGHIFEETEEFVSRFYFKIEQSRLAIQPEDYAKNIEEGDDLRGDNPYSVGYVVGKQKYLGCEENKI